VWRGTQGLYHRVETANGYSGMLNGAYAKATGWGQHGIWVPWQLGIDALRGSNRILDVLGVRFVAVPRYHADAVSRLPGIGGEPRFRVAATLWDIVLFENLQPLPRVYLATQVAAVPDQDAAVRALRAGQIDPWRTPVVEEPIPALAAGAADEARLALLTARGADRIGPRRPPRRVRRVRPGVAGARRPAAAADPPRQRAHPRRRRPARATSGRALLLAQQLHTRGGPLGCQRDAAAGRAARGCLARPCARLMPGGHRGRRAPRKSRGPALRGSRFACSLWHCLLSDLPSW